MSSTSRTTVEITVISAERLQADGGHLKNGAFAVVRPDSKDFLTTKTDGEGGDFPSWNEKLVVELPADAASVVVEVHSGRKMVGAVNIPVSDFLGGYFPDGHLHFLSYRLKDERGEKNGIVNLSLRVKVPASDCGSSAGYGGADVGVPVGSFDGGAGVVTGIPVWWAYGPQ